MKNERERKKRVRQQQPSMYMYTNNCVKFVYLYTCVLIFYAHIPVTGSIDKPQCSKISVLRKCHVLYKLVHLCTHAVNSAS